VTFTADSDSSKTMICTYIPPAQEGGSGDLVPLNLMDIQRLGLSGTSQG
jgi:hypothetical protein